MEATARATTDAAAAAIVPKVVPLELHRHTCPACGLLTRCTVHIRGELAVFECHPDRRGCGTRYWIGYGARPFLHAEPIDAGGDC